MSYPLDSNTLSPITTRWLFSQKQSSTDSLVAVDVQKIQHAKVTRFPDQRGSKLLLTLFEEGIYEIK